MKVIIMAGGKGTRVESIAGDIPKPMIPICGKPVLEYQIDSLKENDLTDITLVVGHLGHKIKEYFGDGASFDCKISYFTETEPLGTAGALYKIDDLPDNFILINGDIIFDLDFSRMINFHIKKNGLASIVVHPNSHPFDSVLIETNSNDQVTKWLNKDDNRNYYQNLVNAGIHIISKSLIANTLQNGEIVDLDRDLLKPSIQTGSIFAYQTPEYIKDMGLPDRIAQVSIDIENGTVKKKNLKTKQKCVFLDRDGTINKFNDFIKKPEEFELIDGVAEAIGKINSIGYLAIVITNQPVIARGEVEIDTLNLIHMKMETDLGNKHAYIDDLFYCPHHPDSGFPGEKSEYKIDCSCRKPKPGMILTAADKYNIDLRNSYMVGDDMRDIQAGIAAGCIPVFLTNISTENETSENRNNILQFSSLIEFVETCL
jgi:D-glycero-D-manno-heptose 1,7-bisphosphate phosphatase